MIKAVLFDADGVVIRKRERFFSERLAEKCGAKLEDLLPFFKHDMREAFVNKVDIRESLANYLPMWHWPGTVDEFLAYWFSEESPRDEEMLAFIQELRKAGLKCYLATDREHLWGDYLKHEVGLEKDLDGFMYSYELGFQKHEPGFFVAAAKRLHLEPQEIMYWDDDEKNVEAARQADIDARWYTDLAAVKNSVRLSLHQ